MDEIPATHGGAVWGWFGAWTVVGALTALGFVSLGVLTLVPALVVGGLLWRRPSARRAAFGLLTGVGLLLLFVAYVQRHGPGVSCWSTATSTSCGENLDPRPWLVAGVLLGLGGIAAQARRPR